MGGTPALVVRAPSLEARRETLDTPSADVSFADTTIQSVDDNGYPLRPSPSSVANTSVISYPFSHVSEGPSTSSSRRGLLGRKLGIGRGGPLRGLRAGARSDDASAASARLAADPAAAKLAFLGYEPELLRDHDAWSLLGLTMSNLGAIPGAVFGAVRRPQSIWSADRISCRRLRWAGRRCWRSDGRVWASPSPVWLRQWLRCPEVRRAAFDVPLNCSFPRRRRALLVDLAVMSSLTCASRVRSLRVLGLRQLPARRPRARSGRDLLPGASGAPSAMLTDRSSPKSSGR